MLTIFNRLWTNIRNTFVFSSIAIVFIIILGMLISLHCCAPERRGRPTDGSVDHVPVRYSGRSSWYQLIVAFNKQPVILTGTAMIMIIAFIVRKLPYTVRSGSAFLQQMDVKAWKRPPSAWACPR